ncbi:MAG TPA: phosphatase PAP2 family protein [Terriglobales bacterium]|nr:phosphatase PAP2 family protein [Terriglobales bacterium]
MRCALFVLANCIGFAYGQAPVPAQAPAAPGQRPQEQIRAPGNAAVQTVDRLGHGVVAFPAAVVHHWRISLPVVAGTAALMAWGDRPASAAITSPSLETRSRQFSNYLEMAGLPALALGAVATRREPGRWTTIETVGMAALGAGAAVEVVKRTAGRERPFLQGDNDGGFLEAGTSFPSGHAVISFAVASALAHRYPDRRWVRWTAYSLAGVIAGLRFTGKEHFPSDLAVGSGLGYLIGRCAIACRD